MENYLFSTITLDFTNLKNIERARGLCFLLVVEVHLFQMSSSTSSEGQGGQLLVGAGGPSEGVVLARRSQPVPLPLPGTTYTSKEPVKFDECFECS